MVGTFKPCMLMTLRRDVISVVFVMKGNRECGMILFVGIGGPEDRRLVDDSSRVVVVVSDGVDALAALVLPALVDGSERI